ncbi:hypothetical protein ABW286_16680 [Erwinia papayae]|uniref:Bacteriocin n=1 Tax=Erwinia papayae TaxID=206499 RepID=A0ABV3N4X9_9GAMM
MKVIKIAFALMCSVSSAFAFAGVSLNAAGSAAGYTALTAKAVEAGLANVKIDSQQTFDVIEEGKKLGTLVQGKGWVRDVHPVCFVAWITNNQHISYYMETIGVGDWETADCDDVESVGFISKPQDSEKRIAVIYSVDTQGQTANNYVIFGLKNKNEIFYDEKTTVRFQNSYLKTLSALRKSYQGR